MSRREESKGLSLRKPSLKGDSPRGHQHGITPRVKRNKEKVIKFVSMQPFAPQSAFMDLAIREARKAREQGDYAIGAVIVRGGAVIASSGNRVRLDEDPTQHAEMVAIRLACEARGSRFLPGCILYSTHEPCPMCASAIVWAKMEGLVYATTQGDMAAFRRKHGNSQLSWRTIGVPCAEVFAQADPSPFIVGPFMRHACLGLFHDR